ncbi:hypothetical protein PQI66_08865 [Corynebacterium sp. USCH3]|uniref:hypothetical protein n=1 Tax=Corynebacterium sp. USCH3 TaxID=3024840 RepID=UPI0030B67BCA
MDFETIQRTVEKHKRIKEMTPNQIISEARKLGESPLSDLYYAWHVDVRDLDEAVSLRNLERVPTDELLDEFKRRVLKSEAERNSTP